MSDYMFMLENHLSSAQNRVVAEVQAAAGASGVNLFLAGGAVRDMLGGFEVRDLDFTVQGDALKLVAVLKEKGVRVLASDESRRAVELLFPGDVRGQVAMSRVERYARTGASGARPQITPASIHEDLRGRDFSINAMALSLNRASRGLMIDPTNGQADLEQRELRSLSPYSMYDDPRRLYRLVRLKVRLGLAVEERTQTQFDNARAAGVQESIPPRALFQELRQIALEPSPGENLRALEAEGLLKVFSPALTGAKLNLPVFARLEKAVRMVAGQDGPRMEPLGPFLSVLNEKLTPRERAELARNTEMTAAEADSWRKLEPRARKLELALKSPRLRKPSQVYQVLSKAAPDEVCFVLCRTQLRPVQERVRNYFEKYLPLARDFQAAGEVAETAAGARRAEKSRQEELAKLLDRRPPKVEPPISGPAAPEELGHRGPGLTGRTAG
jgi:tRNA nucleotidyltransferase (CCA-adding enzyme)